MSLALWCELQRDPAGCLQNETPPQIIMKKKSILYFKRSTESALSVGNTQGCPAALRVAMAQYWSIFDYEQGQQQYSS